MSLLTVWTLLIEVSQQTALEASQQLVPWTTIVHLSQSGGVQHPGLWIVLLSALSRLPAFLESLSWFPVSFPDTVSSNAVDNSRGGPGSPAVVVEPPESSISNLQHATV